MSASSAFLEALTTGICQRCHGLGLYLTDTKYTHGAEAEDGRVSIRLTGTLQYCDDKPLCTKMRAAILPSVSRDTSSPQV